jgi:flagellar hook-associated protein 2
MLSSPGIGSGLDVNGIVDQLVSLERRPITLLQSAKSRLDTQLSSYGMMQSYMSNLQAIANKLASPSNWTRNTATSGDETTVGVSASATAVAARYSVEVSKLASAQSLSSGVFADPADLGAGTITITRGGTPVDIVIEAGDASLAAVRDKINQAGAGVSAAIVQDAGGPLLVLTGTDTGAANAVTVAVSGASGDLATLSHPGSLTERRAAEDAVFTINGVPLSSASNRLENVIDGVDLTLKKVTSGPVDIDVASDAEALKKDVADFVAAYNDLNRFLAAQTKYDEGSKVAGALQGDRTAVGLIGKLRALVQQPSTASSVFGRLADMGISLERDGSLKIDDGRLGAALADPAEVALAFSDADDGLALRYKALADGMLGIDGALTARSTGLRESIKRNERDQERLEDRVDRVRARLLRQYTALDSTVSQLTGLNNLVTQQLTALANLNKAK